MSLLVTCLLIRSCVVFSKSVALIPGYASISWIHADAVESSSGWYIDSTTKQGFQLKLSMNNTWGFRPGHKSTIEIIIDGDTPLYPVPVDDDKANRNPDLDALFAASVSNQQYIALSIASDNNGNELYASPGCSHSTAVPIWNNDSVNAIVDVARCTRWTECPIILTRGTIAA
eukprot:359664_1